MGSSDEADNRKRPYDSHDGISPSPKKQVSVSEDGNELDRTILLHQNRKLVQELRSQKMEIYDLNVQVSKMKEKQMKYDETLVVVNRSWTQLIHDMELIASPFTNGFIGSTSVTKPITKRNGTSEDFPENTFLARLLESAAENIDIETDENCEESRLEEALSLRMADSKRILSAILELIRHQCQASDQQLALLKKNIKESDAAKLILSREEQSKKELAQSRKSIEELQIQLRKMMSENLQLKDKQAANATESKRFRNELDDALMKIDSLRRKVAALSSGQLISDPALNGGDDGITSREQIRWQDSEEAQQERVHFAETVKKLEMQICDEKRSRSEGQISILNQRISVLEAEVRRCHVLIDHHQAEKRFLAVTEKGIQSKVLELEGARHVRQVTEEKIKEMESKVRECVLEKEAFGLRIHEMEQAAGRKETVDELKAMVGTLHMEMGQLRNSLSKFQQAAEEAIALKANILSLKDVIVTKGKEIEELNKKLSGMDALREENRALKDTERDLLMFINMYEAEPLDSRDMNDLRKSEASAKAKVNHLQALLEQGKAADEDWQALQAKLSSAEEECSKLKAEIEQKQREVYELREMLQAKNEEGETYLSEIENVSEAYNAMQAQNRRLLQQIMERDDYNNKLLSEGVQSKQAYSLLLSEKESMAAQIAILTSVSNSQKDRIAGLEEQVRLFSEELVRVGEEARQKANLADSCRLSQQEAEHATRLAQQALDAANDELAERSNRLAEAEGLLESYRSDKRDHGDLAGDRGQPQTLQKLQSDIKLYKKVLRCPVCEQGQKEVIITKCCHLFCDSCVKSSLESRNRKCPICKVNFGQVDVKRVFM